MDKREMIERALKPFLGWTGGPRTVINALAEQAIVIECGVEHKDVDTIAWTSINLPTKDIVLLSSAYVNEINLSGHHGAPGKAIAIIVSLEDE